MGKKEAYNALRELEGLEPSKTKEVKAYLLELERESDTLNKRVIGLMKQNAPAKAIFKPSRKAFKGRNRDN
jgi:hypothetical protein